jgi:membrane-bound metal-dependent hydrolase YbcI (DUF457 family)
VDPASHALFGALAVTAVKPRAVRHLVITAAIASVLPDFDVLVIPAGWDRYLLVHEIGTHSLAGASGIAVLLAAVLRRRVAAPFAITCAAALAGSLGHVLWDLASGADIRLLWPAASVRIGGHLVAMADPFVLAVVAAGATLALARRRTAHTVAAITMLALAGLLCGKLLLQHRARGVYDLAAARAGGRVTKVMQDARWGSLTRWSVYDRTSDGLRAWRVDSFGAATLEFARARGPADPRIEVSRAAPTVRHAIEVFDLPFAEVGAVGQDAYEVRWSDIRFCRAPGVCDIWFGVQYATDGAPVQQVVRVGSLVQTRPMPR